MTKKKKKTSMEAKIKRMKKHLAVSLLDLDIEPRAICGTLYNTDKFKKRYYTTYEGKKSYWKEYEQKSNLAKVFKEMDCKKCYWYLFRKKLINDEKHEPWRKEGILHERFSKWTNLTDIK